MPQVVVVGAGITGLTVALTLYERNVDVIVLESSKRVGGKILTTEVRGVPVDAGPDAFLVRQPYMRDLCDHLNLADELVAPAPGPAKLWLQGALRPLPRRQYLGVPLDLDEAAVHDIISAAGIGRARRDLTAPADAPVGDESAGALIRRRLGDEVMDRLVGPLLGGINAGDADQLSLRAGVPQLAAAAAHDDSLMKSIPKYLAALARDPEDPIFLTHPNGLGQVTDAMAQRLTGRIHSGHPVSALAPTGDGWEVVSPATADAHRTPVVVLATPAFASADLLADAAPGAASALADIEYASVVMVTFAFASREVAPYEGSGFLVPRREGLLMSACSWASSKWPHLGGGRSTFLRVSAGRHDDTRALAMTDDELVATLRRELEWTAGVTAEPLEVRITKWPKSFPQYRPGHLERVAGIEAILAREAPGVFVTGAAYRGLGLPACVHQGKATAQHVVDHLGLAPRHPGGPGTETPHR